MCQLRWNQRLLVDGNGAYLKPMMCGLLHKLNFWPHKVESVPHKLKLGRLKWLKFSVRGTRNKNGPFDYEGAIALPESL
jgi:hypothetical protein